MANTLLEDLGIAYNFQDLTDGITRAEFCSLIISAINIGDTSDTHVLPYTDVSQTHVYYSAIYDAYALGLISPAELFNPDRIITLNEACKIAVHSISYDFLADANGGWPTGYVVAASSKDLLDGISGDSFTRQHAYTLIYNMLGCPLPLMEFTDGEVYYKIDSGTTLLDNMWHLTKLSGTFDAAQYFGGRSGNGVGSGKAQISGNIVRSGNYNTDAYYGEYADAYVEKDGTIRSLYVYPNNDSSVITISSKQNIRLSNLTYTYEKTEDKDETVTFSRDAILVVNGQPVPYDAAKLVPAYGSVKIVKGVGSSEAVIVESYREIVVGAVLSGEWLVADVRDSSNTFKRDNGEGLTVYDLHNEKIDFSAIEKYSVIWVYESSDGMNDTITVCDDMISGELTGTNDSQIEIDNMLYDITDSARKAMDKTMALGTVLTCSINPNGEIVYVRLAGDDAGSRVGYITFGGLLGSGFTQKLAVEMLTTDGILKTYNFADRVTLNGKSLGESASVQYGNMPHEDSVSSVKTGLVSYTLNDDGQIVTVNYADKVSADFGGTYDNLFQKQSLSDTTDQYVSYKSAYGAITGLKPARIFVTTDTYQFVVPNIEDRSLATDKNYKVMKMSQYSSGSNMSGYVHTGYSFDKDTVYSSYITSTFALGSTSSEMPSSSYLSIVESISNVINEEGEQVGKLSLWNSQKGNYVVYSEDLDFFGSLGIKSGDLVKVEYNSNNIVSGIVLFAHADKVTFSPIAKYGDEAATTETEFTLSEGNCVSNANTGMGTLSESYIVSGKIYNVEGNVVQLIPAHLDPALVNDSTTIFSYSFAITKIYKYNTKSQTIEPIDVTALKSYKDTGAQCDRLVIDSYSGNLLSGFVIE